MKKVLIIGAIILFIFIMSDNNDTSKKDVNLSSNTDVLGIDNIEKNKDTNSSSKSNSSSSSKSNTDTSSKSNNSSSSKSNTTAKEDNNPIKYGKNYVLRRSGNKGTLVFKNDGTFTLYTTNINYEATNTGTYSIKGSDLSLTYKTYNIKYSDGTKDSGPFEGECPDELKIENNKLHLLFEACAQAEDNLYYIPE